MAVRGAAEPGRTCPRPGEPVPRSSAGGRRPLATPRAASGSACIPAVGAAVVVQDRHNRRLTAIEPRQRREVPGGPVAGHIPGSGGGAPRRAGRHTSRSSTRWTRAPSVARRRPRSGSTFGRGSVVMAPHGRKRGERGWRVGSAAGFGRERRGRANSLSRRIGDTGRCSASTRYCRSIPTGFRLRIGWPARVP
jgi:hypothetical protein